MEEQEERLEALGATLTRSHLKEGEPAEEIVRLGEEIDAGLLVLGSRGLGTIARVVLGSVSEKVVYTASRPTLVVRGGANAWPPARVVIGDDSSEPANRAAEAALGVGKLFGAQAILVRTAYPPPSYTNRSSTVEQREKEAVARMQERRQLKRALEKRAQELEVASGPRPTTRAAVGDAAACILDVAEEGDEQATLVAVGGRGLGTVKATFLGSVSRKVLRAAKGPVLVVP